MRWQWEWILSHFFAFPLPVTPHHPSIPILSPTIYAVQSYQMTTSFNKTLKREFNTAPAFVSQAHRSFCRIPSDIDGSEIARCVTCINGKYVWKWVSRRDWLLLTQSACCFNNNFPGRADNTDVPLNSSYSKEMPVNHTKNTTTENILETILKQAL
jgi:hypothetical protein